MKALPTDWSIEPFERVAKYSSGRTPARANDEFWSPGPASVPWVAISDMQEFGTTASTRESISELAFDRVFSRRIVRAGTLLMSFKLTIGRVAYLGVDACHNEAIISIYPRDGVSQRYLGYFLSQVNYADLQDRQIKGNTLNQDKINRIPIVLPPEGEQHAIADVLDRVRLAIGLEDRTIECTASLKSAAMHHLFASGLRGESQRETEIGPIPSSWNCVPFRSVRDRLQYGISVRCTPEIASYPVLRIPNVDPGRVNSSSLKYCDLDGRVAASHLLQEGDLLFIRTNGVLERLGCCAVYSGVPARSLFASYLIRAQLKRGHVEPRFVAFFFSSAKGTSQIAGRATPAADGKYNLNTGIIDSLPIPLPPSLDEQREIVEVLEAVETKINVHRRRRVLLDALFNRLLPRLMTGDVRVSDLKLSAFDTAKPAEVTT